MSGSIKTGLPLRVGDPFDWDNIRAAEDRYTLETREAAVKLLMALYNEFPLRPEEMDLMDRRIQLLDLAERGWFKLLRRECGGLSFPTDRLLAGLTLLEG